MAERKFDNKLDNELDNQQKKEQLDTNLELIIDKEEKLKDKLNESTQLERFTTDIMLFISLIKDYYKGNYRSIPYKTISAGIVGLLYLLNPIDIIPDFVPFIGYIDDALILAFCLKLVENDLQKYQQWKKSQPKSATNKAKSTD